MQPCTFRDSAKPHKKYTEYDIYMRTYSVILRWVLVTILAVEKQGNKYYVFWVRVCSLGYPACKAHAQYYIVICGLSGCTIFFHIISQTERFSEKKVIEHEMRILTFSSNLSEHFLIQKSVHWDIIIHLHRYSGKIPVFLVGFKWNLNFFSTSFRKILKY
jgi:hypothetical protein